MQSVALLSTARRHMSANPARRAGALSTIGALVVSAAASFCAATTALAQDAQQEQLPAQDLRAQADTQVPSSASAAASERTEEEMERLVVTGSRILRDGYEAPTPVTVLGAEQLQADAPLNIANAINQLPVLAGSFTPQNNATSTSTGLASTNRLNLRNMGPGRTLVLFDGRRVVPAELGGSVDINTIPTSLVNRVDIVTGGASAPYGSDAVTGVVNFVLDRNFTGFKGNLMAGVTEDGDDEQYKGELAFGTRFADGRGHVLFGAEHTDVSGNITPADRSWNKNGKLLVNPAYTPTSGLPFFISRTPVEFAAMAPGLLIASGPLRGLEFTGQGAVQNFQYGTDVSGTAMVGGANTDRSVMSLEAPQKRSNAYVNLSYDFSDNFNAWGEFGYAESDSDSICCPQFFSGIGNDRITIQRDNAFLPASVASQMDAAGITSFAGGSTNADLPLLQQNHQRDMRRFALGVRSSFTLGSVEWGMDTYLQRGITRVDLTQPQLNRVKYHRAIDAVVDPTGAIVCRSTLTNPTDGCVPFNRLGFGVASPEGINYVMGVSDYRERFTQDVAEISFTGEPFSSWAGPISTAFGVQYREEKVTSSVDPDSITNQWFSANFKPTFGSYDVLEGFLETVVPLAEDAAWADSLELNAAVRVTDYSTSGRVTTWKGGLVWQPIQPLRLRATQSRDIRAPGLGDLFRAGAVNRANTLDPFRNNEEADFNRLLTGNPTLAPEEADTTGFGIVYQPSWLQGFSASVDYFHIEVEGAFTVPTPEIILQRCFAGDQSYCAFVERSPTGQITFMTVQPINADTHKTSGFDIEATYNFRLADLVSSWGGDLSLRLLATYTETNKSVQNNEIIEIVGQNSGGLPDWRWMARATYINDPLTINLVVRGVTSGVIDTDYIECTSGCPTSTVINRTIDNNHIDGAVYFDTSFGYRFWGGAAEAYLRIDNLLDKDPPIATGDYFLSAGVNPSLYDVLGRMYRTGVRFNF